MRKLLKTSVILLCFPVLVYAGVINFQTKHNMNRGEFAAPDGVFNFELDNSSNGTFITSGIFSTKSIFGEDYSGDLSSPNGVFSAGGSEFRSSNLISGAGPGEFSSAGLIFGLEESMDTDDAFKSPDKGDFKFSLPK
jgi:hypothetical protein